MAGSYDLIVLAALIAGYLFGRHKGFATQLSGILTLVVGYGAAMVFEGALAPAFPTSWGADFQHFAAWSVIYAVVSIVIYLIFLKIHERIKEKNLEELDRRWGGMLGAIKALLLITLLSLIAVTLSQSARDVVAKSPSGKVLAKVALAMKMVLPDPIAKKVGDVVATIDSGTTPTPPATNPGASSTITPRPQPPSPPSSGSIPGTTSSQGHGSGSSTSDPWKTGGSGGTRTTKKPGMQGGW